MNSQFHGIVTGFFSHGPHAATRSGALRSAVSLAIPLLTLYALGRTDLSLYATLGAFAAVYGRTEGYAQRFAMQGVAGITIVCAMLIGTLLARLDTPDALRVLVVALVGTLVTLLADILLWRPAGGLFAVFASGACASIPAHGSSFGNVMMVGGGTVVFSLLVTMAIARWRINWGALFAPLVFHRLDLESVSNALRIFTGTLVAGLAGLFVLGDHWYWAMVAAVAALTGATMHARVTRGLQRFIGTLVGVVIAAGFLWIDPPILATLGLAILFQGFIELIIGRNYAVAMLFITTVALLMMQMAAPQSPEALITNRVLETLIGVTAGLAVTVISAQIVRDPVAEAG